MELMGNLVEQILECRTGDPSVPANQHLIIVMPLGLPRQQFQFPPIAPRLLRKGFHDEIRSDTGAYRR